MQKLRKLGDSDRPILFLMIDSLDHRTGKTGIVPIIKILNEDSLMFTDAINPPTDLGYGWYFYAPDSTEVAALGTLIFHAEATGADPTDVVEQIVAYDPNDTVRLGLTALPNAAFGNDNGLASLEHQIHQKKLTNNKQQIILDGLDYYLVTYDDDGTTEILRQRLEKFGGGSIGASIVNSQTPSIRHKSSI